LIGEHECVVDCHRRALPDPGRGGVRGIAE
jgi:hypothetical protein